MAPKPKQHVIPHSNMNLKLQHYLLQQQQQQDYLTPTRPPAASFNGKKRFTGYDLTRTVHTNPPRPPISIIILTGPLSQPQLISALASRLAHDFGSKHIDIAAHICATVREATVAVRDCAERDAQQRRFREKVGLLHLYSLMKLVRERKLPPVHFLMDIVLRKIDEEVKGGQRRFVITGLPETGTVMKACAETIGRPNAFIFLGIPKTYRSPAGLHRRDLKDLFQGLIIEAEFEEHTAVQIYRTILRAFFEKATVGLTAQQTHRLVGQAKCISAAAEKSNISRPRADSMSPDEMSKHSKEEVGGHQSTKRYENSAPIPSDTGDSLKDAAADQASRHDASSSLNAKVGPSPPLRRKSTEKESSSSDEDECEKQGGRSFKKRKSGDDVAG